MRLWVGCFFVFFCVFLHSLLSTKDREESIGSDVCKVYGHQMGHLQKEVCDTERDTERKKS